MVRVDPALLLRSLILPYGFISSHESIPDVEPGLGGFFPPLARRKHKLVADREKVMVGLHKSCPGGSWITCWWERGKMVILYREGTPLFRGAALRRRNAGHRSPWDTCHVCGQWGG